MRSSSSDLSWDASEDQVRQALELLKGVGRVGVVRVPAGTRGFAWTIEFLDEAASYHAGLEEVTDTNLRGQRPRPFAPTTPSQPFSGRTDFREAAVDRDVVRFSGSEARATSRITTGRPVLAQFIWISWKSRSSGPRRRRTTSRLRSMTPSGLLSLVNDPRTEGLGLDRRVPLCVSRCAC